MAEKRCNRDWCEDVVMGLLSAEAERLFVRLRMKVDAYGRFWGEASMVRGLCLPCLRGCDDGVVDGWLDELAGCGLLVRYAVGAVRYVALVDWDGRVRGASKFPPAVGQGASWLPVSGDGECVMDVCEGSAESCGDLAASCGEMRRAVDKRLTSCGESVTSERQEADKSVTERGELPPLPLFPPAPPISPTPPHISARDGVREGGGGAVCCGVDVLVNGVLSGVNVMRGSELSGGFSGAPPSVEAVYGVMRSLPLYDAGEDELFREWADDCYEHYKGGFTAGGGQITNWQRLATRWAKECARKVCEQRAKEEREARGDRGRPGLREDILLDEVVL